MAGDIHHVQIRTTTKTREKIRRLAGSHNRSTADIVRTSLDLGLRLLDNLLNAQNQMVEEYIRLLKKESRLDKTSKSP